MNDYSFEINNFFPSLREQSLNILLNYLKKYNSKSILEIGSNIGNTSLYLASLDYNVTSIEIKKEFFDICVKRNLDSIKKVQFINADALKIKLNSLYDCIFIDAAKSHYKKYFLHFINNLDSKGFMFIDNINFGIIEKIEANYNKRFKTIYKNMKEFVNYITNDNNYITKFFDIDDGVMIVIKK